ncbi:MAG: hypothetical protein C6I00_07650 [Nitratiruptor sp.]|nr:hypothetical protein [Nitratiruptor sp.]NPA82965.1 hypothetical protein [Campylobacterota bacterium]
MRELFAIIPQLPGVRVYQFAKDRPTSQELATFCKEAGHYLEIAALSDSIYQQIQDLPAKVRRIEESKERYNQRSLHFDTIFIDYDIHRLQDMEQFFRKVYRMTKNAGDIVFQIAPEELDAMTQFLVDLNYVAINPIESQGQLYLTAKKLHGWAKV